MGRRMSVAVLAQAISAASNVLVTVIAARAFDVDGFGRFGVAFLLAAFVVNAGRALIGSPTLVRREAAAHDHCADPIAAALLYGLLGALAMGLLALALGGLLQAPLLALAVVLPGIMLQDVGRSLCFADLRPQAALVLDVQWIVVEIVGLAVVAAVWGLTEATVILTWGGAATLAGAYVLWSNGRRLVMPSFRWVVASWDYAWRYVVAFVATLGAYQITGVLLGVVSGVAAVGAVRGAQTLFGPINNLTSGMLVALVPDGRLAEPNRDVRRQLMRASALLSLVALAITGAALLVPGSIGRLVLGDSWESARTVLLPIGITSALLGSIVGALAGLRGAHAVREGLSVELRLAALVCTIPMLGAVTGDATGYAWALVLTLAGGSVMFWQKYTAVVHAHVQQAQGPR